MASRKRCKDFGTQPVTDSVLKRNCSSQPSRTSGRLAIRPRKVLPDFSDSDDDVICLADHPVLNTQPASVSAEKNRRQPSVDSSDAHLPLIDRFNPRTASELAVNPKKVDEVRKFLRERMEGKYQGHRTLLLTGPSGSGKTATVHVLSQELGMELVEFSCERECEMRVVHDGYTVYEGSEEQSFVNFLRSIEYTKLREEMVEEETDRFDSRPRIVIIEQLPNKLAADARLFQSTVAPFIARSRQILIFIFPDIDSNYELCYRRFFPKEFICANDVTEISLNGSAVTFLTKALERITSSLGVKVPRGELKRIAEESEGDIRCAVNTVGISIGKETQWRIGVHATSNLQIDMFHMLGRILYAKRKRASERTQEIEGRLSDQSLRRPPLERDADEILERGGLGDEQVLLFLSAHAPSFSPSLAALSHTLSTISFCDTLTSASFENRARMPSHAISYVAASATMFHNYSSKPVPSARKGLYKFTKSKWRDVCTEVAQIKKEIDVTLRGSSVGDGELYSLTVPMLRTVRFSLDAFQTRCAGYLSRPFDFSWTVGRDAWTRSVVTGRSLTGVVCSGCNSLDAREVELEIEEDSD